MLTRPKCWQWDTVGLSPSLSLSLHLNACLGWWCFFSLLSRLEELQLFLERGIALGNPYKCSCLPLNLLLSPNTTYALIHTLNTDVLLLEANTSWVFLEHIHFFIFAVSKQNPVKMSIFPWKIEQKNERWQQAVWPAEAGISVWGKHMHCLRTICSQVQMMFIL